MATQYSDDAGNYDLRFVGFSADSKFVAFLRSEDDPTDLVVLTPKGDRVGIVRLGSNDEAPLPDGRWTTKSTPNEIESSFPYRNDDAVGSFEIKEVKWQDDAIAITARWNYQISNEGVGDWSTQIFKLKVDKKTLSPSNKDGTLPRSDLPYLEIGAKREKSNLISLAFLF